MAGLEDLYREIILDHYRSPRNRGELDPPALIADGHNPLCGDEIRISVSVENGLVSDVRFSGSGCSISQSSASMMTFAVKGKPIEQVKAIVRRFKQMMTIDEDDTEIDEAINLGDLEALQGVVKFPVRIKCATLGWNTLLDALATEQQ
jgi:nitrogen fixation NifU-like protein